jgi:hypothetical protein
LIHWRAEMVERRKYVGYMGRFQGFWPVGAFQSPPILSAVGLVAERPYIRRYSEHSSSSQQQ